MPEPRRCRSALAALALLGLALPAAAAPGGKALEAAQVALKRGDGISAEAELRRALGAGVSREQIAAGMGEAEFLQGDFGEARQWLAPGQFAPAQVSRGFQMLARLEMAEGNFPAADAAFDRALADGPGSAEMWVDIGRLRYIEGEHHLALQASLKALEQDRTDPRALEFRGQFVRDSDGPRAALAWFRRGLKSAPNDLALLGEYAATLGELGQAKAMLRITRRMIGIDGKNARAFYLQAVLAARAGNSNLARRLLARTGSTYQQVPAVMLLTGVLELRAGNPALAVEALADLARRQPDNWRVQQLFALALLENGEVSELLARFAPLADRPDAEPYILTLVGRAHELRDDRLAAATYLDRAAAAQAGGIMALANSEQGELAMFRWGDDPGRLDAAIPAIRKALGEGNGGNAAGIVASLAGHYGGSADIQTLAGDVALAQGNAAGALENYRSAAKIRRSYLLVERMVAAQRLLGQDGAARALAADYLQQHPQDGDAARLLAWLAAENGEWRRVRVLLTHVRTLGELDRSPRELALLALAELRLGDAKAARADAEAAYRAQRANGRAAYILALARGETGTTPLLTKAQRLGITDDSLLAFR